MPPSDAIYATREFHGFICAHILKHFKEFSLDQIYCNFVYSKVNYLWCLTPSQNITLFSVESQRQSVSRQKSHQKTNKQNELTEASHIPQTKTNHP